MLFVATVIFSLQEYKRTHDLFNPLVFISIKTIFLFAIPAWVGYETGKSLYMPDKRFVVEAAMLPGFLLLIEYTVFAISYQWAMRYWERKKDRNIVAFSIDNDLFLRFFIFIGFIGVFTLSTLWEYTYLGDRRGAYYQMSGYGWANWLQNIFAIVCGFLALSQYRNKKLGLSIIIIVILLMAFVFNRITSSVMMIFAVWIVIVNPFRDSYARKKVLYICVAAALLIMGLKFMEWNNAGYSLLDMRTVLPWFVMFDLGRFDLLMSALQYQDSDAWLTPLALVRNIPFVGYLPILKDINMELAALPEILLVGEKVSDVGGLFFTGAGEKYMMFGVTGILIYSFVWGVLWSRTYQILKDWSAHRRDSSDVTLGVYVLFWQTNLGLVFPNVTWIIFALFFILLLGRIRIYPVST